MTIIKSQDLNISIPRRRIIRTTVEEKAESHWIITATVENDRPVTLARFPSEKEARAADTSLWICEEPFFYFPVCGER